MLQNFEHYSLYHKMRYLLSHTFLRYLDYQAMPSAPPSLSSLSLHSLLLAHSSLQTIPPHQSLLLDTFYLYP